MRLPCLVLCALLSGSVSRAAVVCIYNATESKQSFNIEHADVKPVVVSVESGEVKLVEVGKEPSLRVILNGKQEVFSLEPYTPYLFTKPSKGDTAFGGVELSGKLPKPDDVPAKPVEWKTVTLPVKLYADDVQQLSKEAWEKKLGARLIEASDLFEKLVGVKFKAVESAEWFSGKDSADLTAALADFELKAELKADQRAVGFLSRAIPGDDFGVAGPPGSKHVLVRETKPRAEIERVEVLAQQLAFTLGGVRSPEPISLLRTKLGDGQALKSTFRLQFDPLNMLVLRVWAEELSAGKGANWADLREPAKQRLRVLYKTIDTIHAGFKSDDTMARDYAEKCGEAPAAVAPSKPESKPVAEPTKTTTEEIDAARTVLQAITKHAESLAAKGEARPKGDDLTAEYLQTAAKAAGQLKEPQRVRGFLYAIGLGLDDSTVLRDKPVFGSLYKQIETDNERKARLKVLGSPTLRNRRDLCQHFAVSALLAEQLGAEASEFVGLTKELADMKGTSGFSFVDLAADYCGVALAVQLKQSPELLKTIETKFKTDDFLIDTKPLKEGFSEARFKKEYGGSTDDRFKAVVTEIRDAVKALPAYKK
jgi:hypothetical protein